MLQLLPPARVHTCTHGLPLLGSGRSDGRNGKKAPTRLLIRITRRVIARGAYVELEQ